MRDCKASAFIALLLLAGAAPPVDAATSPHVLFLTCENRQYAPGDTVNFTVLAFARGEPVQPDGPPLVTVSGRPRAYGTIPIAGTAPGRWEGSYKVLAADADPYGQIEIRAHADFRSSGGGEYPVSSNRLGISLRQTYAAAPQDSLAIRAAMLECPDGAIRPGSVVRYNVCATYDGAPVRPGDISFWMTYRPDGGREERSDLSAVERAPGSYELAVTVPQGSMSGYFHIHASSHGDADRYLEWLPLDFFNVLYHETARNGSRIDYELLVSDRAGNPVNGSDVIVWASPYYNSASTTALELGKTDRRGRVRGLFDLGPSAGEVYFRGWANTSKASQYFSASIWVSDARAPSQPQGSELSITRLGPQGYLPAGAEVNVTYRAFLGSTPISRQALDCYILFYGGDYHNIPESLRAIRLVTGEDGSFTVNLTLPPGDAAQAVVTVIGPGPPYQGGYSSASDWVRVSGLPVSRLEPVANITFSKASPGAPLLICASATGGGLQALEASWSFTYNESTLERPWLVLTTFTWFLPAKHREGRPVTGQMVLPAHLKPGQNLTVSVAFTNASGQTASGRYTLKVRSPAAAEPPSDVCCITGIFVVNAMLIALLFFNYLQGRRGERRRSLEELDADAQIGAVLASTRAQRDLSLPIKVELARSEECTACSRRIAQGNIAWRCVCGARYHEHCAGDGTKCPSCGRGWKKA